MNILYIHGAGASSLSFKYIKEKLPEHNAILVEVPVTETVFESSVRISKLIENISDVHVISHSLGGLIAINLVHLHNIKSITTISSPFGGHPAALFMGVLTHENVFKDLNPYSSTIRKLQHKWTIANKPHLAIVTDSGLPIGGYSNDCVVTVASQKDLVGPRYETIHLNHFEVLLSDKTIELLNNFIFGK